MLIASFGKLGIKLFIFHLFVRSFSSQATKMSKRKTAGTSNQSIKKFLKSEPAEENKSEAVESSSTKELKSFEAFMEKIESDRTKVT